MWGRIFFFARLFDIVNDAESTYMELVVWSHRFHSGVDVPKLPTSFHDWIYLWHSLVHWLSHIVQALCVCWGGGAAATIEGSPLACASHSGGANNYQCTAGRQSLGSSVERRILSWWVVPTSPSLYPGKENTGVEVHQKADTATRACGLKSPSSWCGICSWSSVVLSWWLSGGGGGGGGGAMLGCFQNLCRIDAVCGHWSACHAHNLECYFSAGSDSTPLHGGSKAWCTVSCHSRSCVEFWGSLWMNVAGDELYAAGIGQSWFMAHDGSF
jgi:hypothetical protein